MDYEGHSYTITSIGDNAFRYSTISSITIAEGIVSVGQYALRNCTSLTTLTFPNSCIRFGRTAVGDCTSLTQIHFGASPITFSDNFGRLCGKQLTDAYFECAQPPTVGSYFFNYNQSLTLHVPSEALEAYSKALPPSTYPNFRFVALGASDDTIRGRLKPGDKFMADGLYYLVADDAQSVTVTYPSKNAPHCWQQSIHGEYQHTSVCGLRRTFLHHNVNRRQRLSLLHH